MYISVSVIAGMLGYQCWDLKFVRYVSARHNYWLPIFAIQKLHLLKGSRPRINPITNSSKFREIWFWYVLLKMVFDCTVQ